MAKTKRPLKKTRKQDAYSKELKKLGDRIRSLRIAAGYESADVFAYEHEMSRSQMGRYERGEDLRYTSLLKVCNAFGITIQEFFSEGF